MKVGAVAVIHRMMMIPEPPLPPALSRKLEWLPPPPPPEPVFAVALVNAAVPPSEPAEPTEPVEPAAQPAARYCGDVPAIYRGFKTPLPAAPP